MTSSLHPIVAPRAAQPGIGESWIPTTTRANHASFVHLGDNGTLYCAWFGGSAEGRPDAYIRLSTLAPGADEWTVPIAVSRDADRSEQNPVIYSTPGRLHLLYTSQLYGSQETSVIMRQSSDDAGATWSEPHHLVDTVGIFIRQPLVKFDESHWILPVFHCTPLPGRQWQGDSDTSAVLVTRDAGQSWSEIAVPQSLGMVHMCIVLLADGTLAAFYRSRWADWIFRSTSADEGTTWSVPEPTDIPNNNSSIQVSRGLGSELFLVANPIAAPPGSADGDVDPVDEKGKAFTPGEREALTRHAVWGVPRVPLTLFRSDDDGVSWTALAELETRESLLARGADVDAGGHGAEISYPAITVTPDGTAHITYTWLRDAIKYVRVSPEVLAS